MLRKVPPAGDGPTVPVAEAEKPRWRTVLFPLEVTSRQPQAYGTRLRKPKAPSVTDLPLDLGQVIPPHEAPLFSPLARGSDVIPGKGRVDPQQPGSAGGVGVEGRGATQSPVPRVHSLLETEAQCESQ